MYRFVLLIALAPTCFASFRSYCTTTMDGVEIASNTYSDLLPEGMGRACPDVSFEQFQTFYNMSISAIEADPTWDLCLHGCISYGGIGGNGFRVVFADYLESPEWMGFAVEFGQDIVASFPQTLTLQRPPGTSATYAELQLGWEDFGDHDSDHTDPIEILRPATIGINLDYPQQIQYGIPFQVTGTVSITGVRLRLPAGFAYPGAGYRYYHTKASGPVILTAIPIADTPIPEPSTFAITGVILVLAFVRSRRKSSHG